MRKVILRDKRSGLEVEKSVRYFSPLIETYVDDGKWCYKKLFVLDYKQSDDKYIYLFSSSKRAYRTGGWKS